MSCVSFPYRIVLFEVLRCIFLSVASDLSNEDDALCLRILQEHLQTIYEVCSVEWIPANTLQETKQTPVVYKRCSESCTVNIPVRLMWLTVEYIWYGPVIDSNLLQRCNSNINFTVSQWQKRLDVVVDIRRFKTIGPYFFSFF